MKFNELDCFASSGEFHESDRTLPYIDTYLQLIISKLWKIRKKRSPIRSSLRMALSLKSRSLWSHKERSWSPGKTRKNIQNQLDLANTTLPT